MIAPPPTVSFPALFGRSASRIRRTLALRHAASGAALGLSAATAAGFGAWSLGQTASVWIAAPVASAGLLGGLTFAWRRRWSDAIVAQWLDARLGGREAVASALESSDAAPGVRVALEDAACRVLGTADAALARPRRSARVQALLPLAAACLALVTRLPPRAGPAATTAVPPSPRVSLGDERTLARVAALAAARARDDAQRERLQQLAKDAGALRADLAHGLPPREATERLARLRDALAAERSSLGDGPRRAGLEAAISRLSSERSTRAMASALGDHDLERMDKAMERLANAREQRDRQAARDALAEAARAAERAGAADVARALEAEAAAGDARAERTETLRELARALDEAGKGAGLDDALDALDRERTDAAARALASALERALEGMSEEDRARLLKRSRDRGRSTDGGLDAPRASAEQALRGMEREDDTPGEARTEATLLDAERDVAGALGELRGERGAPSAGPGTSEAQAGSHHDTGTGSHDGKTEAISAATMRSRAPAKLDGRSGLPGSTTGWAPGARRPSGETAAAGGLPALLSAGAGEIDGVDATEVPEPFRQQVRTYFEP